MPERPFTEKDIKKKASINKKSDEDRSWETGAKVFTRKEVANIIIDQRKKIFNELVTKVGTDAANSIMYNAGITKF